MMTEGLCHVTVAATSKCMTSGPALLGAAAWESHKVHNKNLHDTKTSLVKGPPLVPELVTVTCLNHMTSKMLQGRVAVTSCVAGLLSMLILQSGVAL